MSTFSGWWLSFKKNRTPRQVTWLCGSEPVLVDEVVDLIRDALKPDPINFIHLDAREQSARYIWNELRQYPFGANAVRLTVVRGAEKLSLGEEFQQYIKDRSTLPRNYVVFLSTEDSLRKKDDGKTIDDGLEYLKGRGALIECKPFTRATAKHAVAWVREKAEIRGSVAEHVLNRATGDLRLVRDTMQKMSLLPGEVTLAQINEMFAQRPNDTFLGALFALDRKTALAALQELPREDYSRTLGLVDARLDLAGLVHDMQMEHKTPGEIARSAGNKGFLVPEILPVAKHYNKKRRLRIRQYLALIDGYSDYGIPDGALEGLVILW